MDAIDPAARDASGKVLADSVRSRVQLVRCTVVGRVQIVGCRNPEAWRHPRTHPNPTPTHPNPNPNPNPNQAWRCAGARLAHELPSRDLLHLGDGLVL